MKDDAQKPLPEGRGAVTAESDTCEKCGRKLPHPRNQARHNLLFAILVPAFKHWPEADEFQPENTEHLRSWLLCKAGHNTFKDIEIESGTIAEISAALTGFMKAMPTADGSKPVHFKQTKTGIRGYQAKSISYTKCNEDDFKKILDRVVEIVETIIGVKIEKLKSEVARET